MSDRDIYIYYIRSQLQFQRNFRIWTTCDVWLQQYTNTFILFSSIHLGLTKKTWQKFLEDLCVLNWNQQYLTPIVFVMQRISKKTCQTSKKSKPEKNPSSTVWKIAFQMIRTNSNKIKQYLFIYIYLRNTAINELLTKQHIYKTITLYRKINSSTFVFGACFTISYTDKTVPKKAGFRILLTREIQMKGKKTNHMKARKKLHKTKAAIESWTKCFTIFFRPYRT